MYGCRLEGAPYEDMGIWQIHIYGDSGAGDSANIKILYTHKHYYIKDGN